MHRIAAVALLGVALAFTGCGDDKPTDEGKNNASTNNSSSNESGNTGTATAEAAPALAGAGWMGSPVDFSKDDGKLYGIVFFKPG